MAGDIFWEIPYIVCPLIDLRAIQAGYGGLYMISYSHAVIKLLIIVVLLLDNK